MESKERLMSRVAVLVTLLANKVLCEQSFLIEPQDTNAIEGSVAVMKCKVADKIGMLQWTKDSFALGMERNLPGFPRYQMIGGSTTVGSQVISEHNLKITDIRLEDDAEYQCQVGAAETVQGIRSRTARLNVLLPPDLPKIDGGMRRIAVVAGRLANISCRANNGKPAATITWHMNNRRLTDMLYSRSIPRPNDKRVDSVGIISINATKSDAGRQIECRAQNDAMVDAYSVKATLDVQYPPEIMMGINISRTIREYDFLQFSCRGSANPEPVAWKWLRNGYILQGESRNILDIPSISRDYHLNTITCQATNAVGTTQKNYKLNVEYGPVFVGEPMHIAVNLNQEAILKCEAKGNPRPSIIWTKEGSHLVQGSSPTLRIPQVKDGHFGVYVCTANVLGFSPVSREIYLLQNAPPKIMSEAKQYAVKGDKAKLECLAMSVPKPDKILWIKDGEQIRYATSGKFSAKEVDLPYGRMSTLQIINVDDNDFGLYNCSVINNYGKDVMVIELIQKAVPPLPIIIGGAVGGIAVLFIIILACVLYHRYRSAETGSVLGSYTDTDSSTDKKRDKSDSPSTLMDQWRQDYNKDVNRYSAEYDEVLYSGQDMKGNNNQYNQFPNGSVYRDTSQIFDGEYMSRTDEVCSDRYGPTYSGQYPLSSFRADYADPRLPPPCLSTTKLATNV